jgi:hypothetical protein
LLIGHFLQFNANDILFSYIFTEPSRPSSVGRGGIRRSRIGGSFVFGILGFTFVLDISDVSVAVSLVGHDLSTAIGKYNTVTAAGY